MSDLLTKIKSRGYWRTIIRPTNFVQARIGDVLLLSPLMGECRVNVGRWMFPWMLDRTNIQIHEDFIAQEVTLENTLDVWRLYQSGQFVDMTGMFTDWYDLLTLVKVPPVNPGTLLLMHEVVARYTFAYEFATRLALRLSLPEVEIDITSARLQGRRLVATEDGQPRGQSYAIPEWRKPRRVSTERLTTSSAAIAVEDAGELLDRCGVRIARDWIQSKQEDLFKGFA